MEVEQHICAHAEKEAQAKRKSSPSNLIPLEARRTSRSAIDFVISARTLVRTQILIKCISYKYYIAECPRGKAANLQCPIENNSGRGPGKRQKAFQVQIHSRKTTTTYYSRPQLRGFRWYQTTFGQARLPPATIDSSLFRDATIHNVTPT